MTMITTKTDLGKIRFSRCNQHKTGNGKSLREELNLPCTISIMPTLDKEVWTSLKDNFNDRGYNHWHVFMCQKAEQYIKSLS